MGHIIAKNDLDKQITSKLVVYDPKYKKLFLRAVSLSKPISEKLLEIPFKRRTIHIERCFKTVLSHYPNNVEIKDIDVMFNPSYQVDVLKILIAARKNKPYSLLWPGRYENGVLLYGENRYPDYKVYPIKNYDIIYII